MAVPTVPDTIPETQDPCGFEGSTGWTAISLGSILNEIPANVRATVALPVQGMVKPPWPSDCEPGMRLCIAVASAGGTTSNVVPKKSVNMA